jgi:SAM-dependent methyltransferase
MPTLTSHVEPHAEWQRGYSRRHALIRRLMLLRESKIEFDPEAGAHFHELFDHPEYLRLSRADRSALAVSWAQRLYDWEDRNPLFEEHFGALDLAPFTRGGTILDIGCYVGGKTVRWLDRFNAAEIYGIDIDRRYIEAASMFAQARGKSNAHFRIAYADALPFGSETFDAIFTENTLEHVPDVAKTLRESWRVLKPGGILVAIFPSFWCPVGHHLNLVTRVPFVHWFFRYPDLLQAYFSILDERGAAAYWYRRAEHQPLPYERGYTINGTSARGFRKIVDSQRWNIIADGFKCRGGGQSLLRQALIACAKATRLPPVREMLPIAYVLGKRESRSAWHNRA